QSVPEFDHSFQIVFPTGGFGGLIVAPWEERERNIFEIHAEVSTKAAGLTGIRAPIFLPPALPNPGMLPVEFVVASTADHEEILRYIEPLQEEAMKSGMFAFPPIVDVRIDQR